METIKKTELSLNIDGSKIIFEYYGDINNAKKIFFSMGFFIPSTQFVIIIDTGKNNNIASIPVCVF